MTVVELVPICTVDGASFAGYGVRVVGDGDVARVLGFAAGSSRSLASRKARVIAKREAPGVRVVVVKGQPRGAM